MCWFTNMKNNIDKSEFEEAPNNQFSLKRLPVKKAMAELNIKDYRTFKRWAERHDVEIFEDIGTSFVSLIEFIYKANELVNSRMERKYGKNWSQTMQQSFMPVVRESEQTPIRSEQYIPQGQMEKRFLSRLKNKLNSESQ